jgi:hypothetical protein
MDSIAPDLPSTASNGRAASGRAQAAEILLKWRETDRRLRAMEPGPEADGLLADLLRLRADYLSVVDGDGKALRTFPVSDRYLLSS